MTLHLTRKNLTNVTAPEHAETEDMLVVTGWALLGGFGLITNVLILLGILTSVKLRNSTSYWLIVSLSICDTSMLLVSMGHLLPATALGEKYVGLDDFANAFGIFIYDAFWYTGVLHLMIMAINRYVNICRPKYYLKLFSNRKTLSTIAVLYVFGVLVAVPGLFKCCYLVFNYKFYAAEFIPPNSPYAYADLTVNALSIIVMVFCYTHIVMRVRRSRIMLMQYKRLCREQSAHQSSHRNMSKFARLLRPTLTVTSRREVRLFFQFATVSVIFFLSFATWGWLPRLSGSKWVGLVVTSLFFINNSTNPTVYLIFNGTLRRQLKKLFCLLKLSEERPNVWAELRNGTANNNFARKSYNRTDNNNRSSSSKRRRSLNSSKRRLKRLESGNEETSATEPCNFTAMTAFFNSAVLTTNVFMVTSDQDNEGGESGKLKIPDNVAEPPVSSSVKKDNVGNSDDRNVQRPDDDDDQSSTDQEPSVHL